MDPAGLAVLGGNSGGRSMTTPARRAVCRACGDRLPSSRFAAGVCAPCDRDRLREVCGLDHGRLLTCIGCRALVQVFEAAHGARSDDEHRYLDPDSYVCGDCCATVAVPARPGPSDTAGVCK